MELILFDFENKYTSNFLRFIIRAIQSKVATSINADKLILIDEYLQLIENIEIPAYELILEAVNNLKVITFNQKIIITVDKLRSVDGSTAKLIDIIKLINYGNLALKGYPIISDTFDYIKKNIDNLYDIYINGGF